MAAGTFVAVPLSIGVAQVGGLESWDASPDDQPGRVAVAWLNVMRGVAMISAYFWNTLFSLSKARLTLSSKLSGRRSGRTVLLS